MQILWKNFFWKFFEKNCNILFVSFVYISEDTRSADKRISKYISKVQADIAKKQQKMQKTFENSIDKPFDCDKIE